MLIVPIMGHMAQIRDSLESEIILALLGGENHLRGIASGINVPRMSTSRILDKLVGENVLDFKKEGRNKVFFIRKTLQAKNYVFNAERHKLIKLLKKHPELGVIIEDILKNCGEPLVVLFGSYAKGTAKKDSDIDIYIGAKNRKTKEKIEALHSKIKVKLGDFDLNDYLIKEIVKNHIILKGVEDFYERTGFFE